LAVRINNERLREAREVALLSQRELAEKAGVSLDTVQRMEVGEGGVYGRTVRRVASALDIDPRELLGGPAAPLAPAR
jgi:transcriptional regulator with XRE-family HTH domain